jgi:hypothetical protein
MFAFGVGHARQTSPAELTPAAIIPGSNLQSSVQYPAHQRAFRSLFIAANLLSSEWG